MVPRGLAGRCRGGRERSRRRTRERPRDGRVPACSVVRCDTPISSRRGWSVACRPALPWPRCGAGAPPWSASPRRRSLVASGSDGFAVLDALTPGFWVGWCAFELGHAAERVVARGASTEPASVPDAVFARFDAARGRRRTGRHPRARRRTGPRAPRRTRSARPASAAHLPMPSTHWHSGLDRDAYDRSRRHRARPAARGRVLPGQPHPSAHVRRRPRPGRAVRRARARAPGAAPHAAAAPGARLRHRGRVGVARALPAACADRDVETRPIKGTAATSAALRGQRQGPRRERDDRRPRPQRPRPRVRRRVGAGPGAVLGRVAPRAAPPREHGAGSAARRRRARRARARPRSRPRR